MLGDCSQNVQGQLRGVRVIDRNELNPGFHQGRDESQMAGEAIEFGNNQLGLLPATSFQRLRQFGPIGPLATLNLNPRRLSPCQR